MHPTRFTPDEARSRIAAVPFWWHSTDVGAGVVSPGHKTPERLQYEIDSMRLPDLAGKSVLDIGAWDGFFSFAAEQRGASRVLALDHYVWCMDVPAMMTYWEDCKSKGVVPRQYDEVPGLWHPTELPGKRGFDTAHDLLGSRVESQIGDFMTVDLDVLGTFDVVFYLGVLYHVHNPFEAIKRLARVTRELAVIETEAIVVPGHENVSLVEFYPSNELNADINNWWAPTAEALAGMCRAAGFSRVESLVPPPPVPPAPSDGADPGSPQPFHYRAVVQAWT